MKDRDWNLGIVLGWLIAKDAPPEVREAVDKVRIANTGPATRSDDSPPLVTREEATRVTDGDTASSATTDTPTRDGLASPSPAPKPAGEALKPEGSSPEAVLDEQPRHKSKSIPDEDLELIKKQAEDGVVWNEIGRPYGVHGATVKLFLRNRGVTLPPRPRGGARNDKKSEAANGPTSEVIEEATQVSAGPAGSNAKPGENVWQQWQIDKLVELKRAGMGSTAIGNAIGKTAVQVNNKWSGPGGIKYQQAPDAPIPTERLIDKHNSYAGKRDPQPNPLQDSDWPDIKLMLEKHRLSVSQIASDYDVDFDTMRSFIDRHTFKKAPEPGEAHAPLPSVAGGAAREVA